MGDGEKMTHKTMKVGVKSRTRWRPGIKKKKQLKDFWRDE